MLLVLDVSEVLQGQWQGSAPIAELPSTAGLQGGVQAQEDRLIHGSNCISTTSASVLQRTDESRNNSSSSRHSSVDTGLPCSTPTPFMLPSCRGASTTPAGSALAAGTCPWGMKTWEVRLRV